MSIIKSLEKRRTYYNLDKKIPISEQEVEEKVKKVTELVPDRNYNIINRDFQGRKLKQKNTKEGGRDEK